MKKRIAALVLACALVLCAAPLSFAQEGVRIVFWHSMSDAAGQLVEKYVQEFNDTVGKEKGITVESVFQGTYADVTTKMNSIISAGQTNDLPDVMNLDATGKIAYQASGVAYTADEAAADDPAFGEGLLESVMGNWKFAGQQLGLPFAASTTLLFYNKTLLDQAGLPAPQTFQDIIKVAAALPKTTADGAELVTYAALPNTPTLANWLGQMGSYVVDIEYGSEATATALVCIENGALAAFLTEWKAMYDAGALKNVAGSTDSFVAGQLALITTSSSNVTSLLSKINGAFELGVAFYPKVNAEASFGATVSGSSLVMFDHDNEARKAAARELVKYLTSPAVQADFAAGTGYTPVNKGSAEESTYKDLLASFPQHGVALEQLSLTPAAMRSVTVGPSRDFYYAIQDTVSAMLEEGLSVEETVELMEEELGGLLYQFNQAN